MPVTCCRLERGSDALYAEKWVPFTQELAVMVARSTTGEIQCYPVVKTVQRDNICHLVFAPARVSDATREEVGPPGMPSLQI